MSNGRFLRHWSLPFCGKFIPKNKWFYHSKTLQSFLEKIECTLIYLRNSSLMFWTKVFDFSKICWNRYGWKRNSFGKQKQNFQLIFPNYFTWTFIFSFLIRSFLINSVVAKQLGKFQLLSPIITWIIFISLFNSIYFYSPSPKKRKIKYKKSTL